MSGVEVFGAIAGTIALIETTDKLYKRIQTFRDLPQAFESAANKLPLVKSTLTTIQGRIENNSNEDALRETTAVVYQCRNRAELLQQIFESISSPGTNLLSEYRIALKRIKKADKVENLAKGMLEDLLLLSANQTIQGPTHGQVESIRDAIKELSSVHSLLQDDAQAQNHTVTGHNIKGDSVQHGSKVEFNGGSTNSGFIIGSVGNFHSPVKRNLVHECQKSLAFPKMHQYYRALHDMDNITDMHQISQGQVFKSWASGKARALCIDGHTNPTASAKLLMQTRDFVREKPQFPNPVYFSFFFYEHGSDIQRTAIGLYRTLLHQMLEHADDALAEVLNYFQKQHDGNNKHDKGLWYLERLQVYFELSLKTILKTRHVWLFIDQLHKFGKRESNKPYQLLQKLLSSPLKRQLHCCFTGNISCSLLRSLNPLKLKLPQHIRKGISFRETPEVPQSHSISFRNWTPRPLKLTHSRGVEPEERSEESSKPMSAKFKTVFRSIKPQEETLDPRNFKPINVEIDSFSTESVDVLYPQKHETIRLFFDANPDEPYEVDISGDHQKPTFTAVTNIKNSKYDLVAVCVGCKSLAIFPFTDLRSWMGALDNRWPLSALSIPGTHNSAAYYIAPPAIRCQDFDITTQLENGVRFVDVCVSSHPGKNTVTVVHNLFTVAIFHRVLFKDLCDKIHLFLAKNQRETVILHIKNGGYNRDEDEQLSLNLRDIIASSERLWWTKPDIPTLGEARGKIILLRRYRLHEQLQLCHEEKGYGIDVQRWPSNCKSGIVSATNGDDIHVQDFFNIRSKRDVKEKIGCIQQHLERAAEQSCYLEDAFPIHPSLFLNFLSGGNFTHLNTWPEDIAVQVNPEITEYLCTTHGELGKGPQRLGVGLAGTGIVVADWVGVDDNWTLTRSIVGMNARLGFKNTRLSIGTP